MDNSTKLNNYIQLIVNHIKTKQHEYIKQSNTRLERENLIDLWAVYEVVNLDALRASLEGFQDFASGQDDYDEYDVLNHLQAITKDNESIDTFIENNTPETITTNDQDECDMDVVESLMNGRY